jgi:signal transduction histidine kinase
MRMHRRPQYGSLQPRRDTVVKVHPCSSCGEPTKSPTCASCGVDQADQTSELAASERDQRAETRDRAAEARDRGADDRDAGAREQELTARQENDQDQRWSDHDREASIRDQRSSDGDQDAADLDLASGGDAATHRAGAFARKRSRRERDAVTVSRSRSSVLRLDRQDAGLKRKNGLVLADRDRTRAADDRHAAAADREQAANDRVEALRGRAETVLAAQRSIETLEAMSDSFFTVDSEWRFTYLNTHAESLLGHRADLVGKVLWRELPDAVGTESDDQYRRAVREQVPVRFQQAYESLGRSFDVRAYPITGGLAVYFNEVAAERLVDDTGQTERLEALGRVTAGVAHDFNNLLTGIGGFAELGRAAAIDEKTAGYFDEIHSVSDKAAALTRRLLAFVHERELAPTAIDLNDVVGGIFSLMRQLMPVDTELRLVLSPAPVIVFADKSQLEQVVVNLVVNGRDAIDGPGSVTVRTANSSPVGIVHEARAATGWIQIADTGCGIPEDLVQRIFEPFFTTKRAEGGSGLGLSNIKRIVSRSGGSVFVDSVVGTGMTITVAFPAEHPEPAFVA